MIKYIFVFLLLSSSAFAETLFAEIDKDGNVLRVIVADQQFINTGRVGNPKNWVRTYYDNSQRKNYASKGFKYDKERDAFIPPKAFNSWILDETTARWKAPIEYPKDGKPYIWDENLKNWKETKPLIERELQK